MMGLTKITIIGLVVLKWYSAANQKISFKTNKVKFSNGKGKVFENSRFWNNGHSSNENVF